MIQTSRLNHSINGSNGERHGDDSHDGGLHNVNVILRNVIDAHDDAGDNLHDEGDTQHDVDDKPHDEGDVQRAELQLVEPHDEMVRRKPLLKTMSKLQTKPLYLLKT